MSNNNVSACYRRNFRVIFRYSTYRSGKIDGDQQETGQKFRERHDRPEYVPRKLSPCTNGRIAIRDENQRRLRKDDRYFREEVRVRNNGAGDFKSVDCFRTSFDPKNIKNLEQILKNHDAITKRNLYQIVAKLNKLSEVIGNQTECDYDELLKQLDHYENNKFVNYFTEINRTLAVSETQRFLLLQFKQN